MCTTEGSILLTVPEKHQSVHINAQGPKMYPSDLSSAYAIDSLKFILGSENIL